MRRLGWQPTRKHLICRAYFINPSARSAIHSALRPKWRVSSQASPLSPNRSQTPTMSILSGVCFSFSRAAAPATILPKPPTWCSSTVKTVPISLTASRIVFSSNGLMVCKLMTRAWMSFSSFRIQAARMASGTIAPQAMMAMASFSFRYSSEGMISKASINSGARCRYRYMFDSFWRHRMGYGVANRLNGVVMELAAGGTYTIPTVYQ